MLRKLSRKSNPAGARFIFDKGPFKHLRPSYNKRDPVAEKTKYKRKKTLGKKADSIPDYKEHAIFSKTQRLSETDQSFKGTEKSEQPNQ